MKVIYGLTNFKPKYEKCVIALGVFDGVHRGHQEIIASLVKEAKRYHTKSMVVTFFPHPQREDVLYSLSHRIKFLKDLGVDLCLVINFTPALRRVSAEDFFKKVILKKINPIIIYIGRNFTFGRKAEGNWRMLREYSSGKGFKLRVMDVLCFRDRKISSSWIRSLIKKGDFALAGKLLGRAVSVFGKVTRGYSFARRLGFPTANINPNHEVVPAYGVYAVRVKLEKKYLSGICYIGDSPTLKSIRKKKSNKKRDINRNPHLHNTNIEVHIFDFRGNLYGRNIQIEFIKRIRFQKKFDSIGLLTRQIEKDILKSHTTSSTYIANNTQ